MLCFIVYLLVFFNLCTAARAGGSAPGRGAAGKKGSPNVTY